MLNVEVCGEGPELVLLHGWGMHAGVMWPWAQELSTCFRVSAVDLPGHGNSRLAGLTELEDWADAVLETVPAGAWWLGWSLGGLVALAAARRQAAHVRGVALVAATPKFVAAADWQSAVDAQVFEQFAQQLRDDIDRTLLRFLSLQVRGSAGSGQTLRQLRAQLHARAQADPQALRSGLGFLQHCDMRRFAAGSELPLFWLLGERDTLVPRGLCETLPRDRCSLIKGAGHAPFLSHQAQCTEQIKRWLLAPDERNACAAS